MNFDKLIKVKNEIPEYDREVLCVFINGNELRWEIFTLKDSFLHGSPVWKNSEGMTFDFESVFHWILLPELITVD